MSRTPVPAQQQQQQQQQQQHQQQQQQRFGYNPLRTSQNGALVQSQATSNLQHASPRAILREKWTRVFGGPHYLEGGISNRLVLSLRSSLAPEIDWALDRLIQVSGTDPDLLRFVEFPGLLDALLGLIQDWSETRTDERVARGNGVGLHRLWGDKKRDAVLRRATEAALVVRNLGTEGVNLDPLKKASKKLSKILADVLEEGQTEGQDGEETTELRLYLLEVFEMVAEGFPLVLPGRPLPTPTSSAGATTDRMIGEDGEFLLPPEPLSSPSVRLFPLLVTLTRSSDRALVLAAFRCLTVLSLNDSSDPVLALVTYLSPTLSGQSLPPPHPHPIETALELLPLADRELSLVVLDFIYQHTLLPINCVLFCSRPDLVHVLRVILSKLHLGARKETVNLVVPVPGGDGDIWYKRSGGISANGLVKPVKYNEPTELTTKMSEPELRMLLSLMEPARALAWMRLAYEEYPDGEVTQVALWTAYRSEFERYTTATTQMLPAAEVVKMSTEAFPTALPMVTEQPDRRFIIRGVRIRDRTDMKQVFKCNWQNCPQPLGATFPEALYWHIHHTHLLPESSPSPPPNRCLWSTCRYFPSTYDHALIPKDLSLHVRTHVPLYHPPPGYGGTPLPSADAIDTTKPWVEDKAFYERYHAETDEAGEPTGLGLLGCLVFRNVSRTIKIALLSSSQNGGGSGASSIGSLTGGEESIFEQFERAAEGNKGGRGRPDELMKVLEKVDFGPARKGVDALRVLELSLVRTAMEDHILARILGEVVGVLGGSGKEGVNGAVGK